MSTWKDRMDGTSPKSQATALEVCWRMYGPNDGVFECALFQTRDGIEVRIQSGPDAVVRSELVQRVEAGRMLAAAWRSGALGAGFADAPPT